MEGLYLVMMLFGYAFFLYVWRSIQRYIKKKGGDVNGKERRKTESVAFQKQGSI